MKSQEDFSLSSYDYHLPEEAIAQYPVDGRDQSRLLVMDRASGGIEHRLFHQIHTLFKPGDVLVRNDTRVFPARLFGRKESGGKVELFLLHYPVHIKNGGESGNAAYQCEVLVKSSRPPRAGMQLRIADAIIFALDENLGRGRWSGTLFTTTGHDLDSLLAAHGNVPLPPYVKREDGPTAIDVERYQTVYAAEPGAVAAPTAGLHFTGPLLDKISRLGVSIASITLHVGHGTFAPVTHEDIRHHKIHQEYVKIGDETAALINGAKTRGAQVWAVGTTTVRALESAAVSEHEIKPIEQWCDVYITPGYTFQVVDNLITNFHLPRSSLLFLVAALCGRTRLLSAYRAAIEMGYRFYSYGDAMALIKSGKKE